MKEKGGSVLRRGERFQWKYGNKYYNKIPYLCSDI